MYIFYSGQRFEYTYGHKGHNSGISVFFELVQPVLVFKSPLRGTLCNHTILEKEQFKAIIQSQNDYDISETSKLYPQSHN